jgi:hypothetical protein
MARIRTIKPEFWSDEKVVECSLNARLLFIGLWNFADDAGRQEDSARQIKMKVFPGDDFSAAEIEEMLRELSDNGLLIRYTVENKRYIQVKGWRHQVINKPQSSKIPGPDGASKLNSGNNTGRLPVGMEGNGREWKEPPSPPTTQTATVPPDDGGSKIDQFDMIRKAIWRQHGLTEDQIKGKLVRATSEGLANIRRWLDLGLSSDEILNAIADTYTAAEAKGTRIGNYWPYLDRVMETITERKTEPEVAIVSPQQREYDKWRERLKTFTGPKNLWASTWGPKPDREDCEAPAALLIEFGIVPQDRRREVA